MITRFSVGQPVITLDNLLEVLVVVEGVRQKVVEPIFQFQQSLKSKTNIERGCPSLLLPE